MSEVVQTWPVVDDVRSAKRPKGFKLAGGDLSGVFDELIPATMTSAQMVQYICHLYCRFDKNVLSDISECRCSPDFPLLALSGGFAGLFIDSSNEDFEISPRTCSGGWFQLIGVCEDIAKMYPDGYYHDAALKILDIINKKLDIAENSGACYGPLFKGHRVGINRKQNGYISDRLEAWQEVSFGIMQEFFKEFPNETYLLEVMRKHQCETEGTTEDVLLRDVLKQE